MSPPNLIKVVGDIHLGGGGGGGGGWRAYVHENNVPLSEFSFVLFAKRSMEELTKHKESS